MSLRSILIAKLDDYLVTVNPNPKSYKECKTLLQYLEDQASAFFNEDGEQGRMIAYVNKKELEDKLYDDQVQGSEKLAEEIFQNLTGNQDTGVFVFDIGGSEDFKLLKKCLWSSLCEYYDITESDVAAEEKKILRGWANGVTGMYVAVPPNLDTMAMKSLLKPKIYGNENRDEVELKVLNRK